METNVTNRSMTDLSNFDLTEKFHFEDDFPISPITTPGGINEIIGVSPSSPNNNFLGEFSSDSFYSQFGGNFGSSVFSTLFSHPFVVLRKQCQVNVLAERYHTQPFTLLPVILRLQKKGYYTMWKGSTSDIFVRLLGQVTETAVCNATGLPKDVDGLGINLYTIRHLLLKSFSYLLLTPFYSASLIKTVQNDIGNDSSSLDFFRESFSRLFGFQRPLITYLPVWKLALPTSAYFTSHYLVSTVVTSLTNKVLLSKRKEKTTNTINIFYLLSSGIIGQLVADALLFPFETVLNRLYIQGTRSLIDNLDTGTSVAVINTNYEGPFDCFNSIVESEGAAGLFKGFGALVIQAMINIALVKLSDYVIKKIDNSS